MIILINGAFGVGKTSVAEQLHENLEESLIFDPEVVGYMLRHMLPNDIKEKEAPSGDFQDFILWRKLFVETARCLHEQYGKTLIVPMTIRNFEYFTEIMKGLYKVDKEVYHFCLTATKETIHKRLLERGEVIGDWCFQQTDKCLASYENNDFSHYINTEDKNLTEIIEEIVEKLN
ncbi:AAA family ATPase [Viridibacillus arvi]|jgi:adenylate kinase family enzyme|uniref:Tunicamycin resistance protein n=1 Tax=Viridibacillus arvi TaxID=263475 RepID=A0A0M0L8P6_9BACL|nr:AAA family ATPase [Viridibacillus arvi]KOO47247.1 tunicamycin resistance protein [Viridibacillus arvi]